MPYISQHFRNPLQRGDRCPNSSGELNFMLTNTIVAYMQHHGLSYKIINDIVGALEGAKMEFYRRVAIPYENKKILANGDVYPEEIVL